MGLPENLRKKKRAPLTFAKQPKDDLMREMEQIGKNYANVNNDHEDEEWVLKEAA